MPKQKRIKTNYPGVYFIESQVTGKKKPERIYYIRYRKDGRIIEEKAGRQYINDMTPAKAATMRGQRVKGQEPTNIQKREGLLAREKAKANKWTVSRLWEEYKINNPSLKSVVTDENRFHNYIEPYLGDKEPSKLIPLDIDRFRLGLLKTKSLRITKSQNAHCLLTPGTVKNILELLRRIINFGVKKNLCNGIVFTIEMPKVNNQKTEDLTPNELESLLRALDEDSNTTAANMIRMALFTGMRRSEMFKLCWQECDFHRGFICLKDPKGGPDQKIPLNDGAREVLESQPRTDSPFVFPGRGGKQRTDIKKAVNRIKEKAGLPKGFRALHGCRHVYASMLASSGQVDMYTLQKLLTHKSPAMTQRYAHLRDDALQRASNLADDIISQAMNGNKEKKVANLEDKRK
jgi:integrase